MIERDAELSSFQHLRDGLASGRAATVLVEGAPGTGRTALLGEFARLARLAGHPVLGARCRTGDVPGAVARRLRADPGRLWRGLGSASPVVLVDDVHWADQESRRWLRALAAPGGGAPGLLVLAGTAALESGDDPVFAIEGVHRMDLGPLSQDGAAAVLAELGVRPVPRTGPVRVAELVEAARFVAAGHGTLGECRAMVAGDRTRRLLDGMPPSLSPVLRALAAGDGRLGERLVAQLACQDDVSEALGRLRSLGLADGGVRGAPWTPAAHEVLAELAEPARDTLIARAAALGRDAGLPAVDVAMILLRAGPIRVPWVRDALRAGARAAFAEGAARDGTALLSRLLREDPPPRERAEVLSELGAAELPGETGAGCRHLAQVLRGVPGDDRGHHRVHAADLLVARGDGLAVRRGIAGTFGDPCLSEEDRDGLVGLYWLAGDHLSGDAGLGSATMPPVPERPAAPAPAAVAALRLALRGSRPSRVRGLARAVLTATGDPVPVSAAVAAAFALQLTDDIEEAAEHVERFVKASRRTGGKVFTARLMLARAELSMAARSWDRGRTDVRALRDELPLDYWHPTLRSRLLAVEAIAHVRAGDPAMAREALALAPFRVGRGIGAICLTYAHGLLLSAEERPREALARFREAGRQMSSRGWRNTEFLPWRGEAAHCLHAVGETAAASALVAEEIVLAREWGTPAAEGKARLCAARLLGGTEDGREHLNKAVELLARATPRASYGQALLELAEARLADGRPAEARAAVELADALTTRHGWDELAPCLAEFGGRIDAGPVPAQRGLSHSQRRVAELAARGVSNAGIAARLAVRKRTVELHLTQVYRKLGIGGRDQLAEALRADG
ncbi:LuxR family transcriptional regulator [Amycolatopsis minnesotensis]|uniref:LuxR family transcriptional regulator n=1 Tax=Amycolatopsis minnesotensis TaxID=337894 RepID=UPI0031D37774